MESFLIRFGLWAVFFGSAVEADAIPVLSGAVSHFGYFGFPAALAASIGGMFAGDCVWYWTGRLFGERLKKTRLFKRRFEKIEKFIDRIGISQVIFSRLFYGTRNATMLFWGIKKLSFLRFTSIDLLGCGIWGTVLLSLGYILSFTVDTVIGDIKEIEILLLIVAVVAVALIALRAILPRPGQEKRRTDGK